MANALKEAPLQNKGLTAVTKEDEILNTIGIELDPAKKYMFELATENEEREMPVVDMRTKRNIPKLKFRPYHNIVFTSQIVWKGTRVIIRYYEGCDTIFASDQPKDKAVIDQFIAQTERKAFLEGKFGAMGYEKMLLVYMFACSWNAGSPYRTSTANQIFVAQDMDKKVDEESLMIDEQEKALARAKDADETKMRIHANYLGIPTIDFDSGNELSAKAIRVAYRKEALSNPKRFNKSFTDKTIEVKYFIDKALESGAIKTNMQPNKATWKSGTVICDISGMQSNEGIAQKLIEFSQLPEGEEFAIQLKALYS